MGFFSAILGEVLPALTGGLIDMQSAEDAEDNSFAAQNLFRQQDRDRFKRDRRHAENYAAQMLRRDRRYADRLMHNDRRYLKREKLSERRYAEKVTRGDRRYMERRLREDRNYSEAALRDDRHAYKADRRHMQQVSNKLAEKTAASRGIDFARLRDDAMKAGFNPLTAMNMAHAYSTDVNYTAAGDVYNNGPAFFNSGAGYNAGSTSGGGSGGGTGRSSAPMSGGVAAGGFQAPGAGYTGSAQPVLSAGSFIAEAMERGIDTWQNTPPDYDPELLSIRDQVRLGLERQRIAAETPRDFGYDLSKVAPYRPAGGVSSPAMSGVALRPVPASPSDDMVDPSRVPVQTPWGDLEPSGQASDQEAVESRYGGAVGEAYGALSFGNDVLNQFVGPYVPPGSGTYFLNGIAPRAPSFYPHPGFN